MRRLGALLLVLALAVQCAFNPASADTRPAPEDRGASGLALTLRRLQTIGSVLHTAAHPDDESTDCWLIWRAGKARARLTCRSIAAKAVRTASGRSCGRGSA